MIKKLALICLCLFSCSLFAEEFVAGKDFLVLHEKGPERGNTISVKEFFSYGCPWCFKLEPVLDQWVKDQGKRITFNKVPVVFNKDWEFYAKAFYTAEALNLNTQFTPLLFKAILTDKQPLNTNEAMIEFFKKHGVDEATAVSAFKHSSSIDLQVSSSKKQMGAYQVSAVPALIVNNQYKTDLQMAKNEERLIAILNYLVNKVSKQQS